MPILLILAVLLVFGWGGAFFLLAIGPLAHLILVVAIVCLILHFVTSRSGGGTTV